MYMYVCISFFPGLVAWLNLMLRLMPCCEPDTAMFQAWVSLICDIFKLGILIAIRFKLGGILIAIRFKLGILIAIRSSLVY